MYNFEPYNVLLAIATNIPVLLMTVKKIKKLYNQLNINMCHVSVEMCIIFHWCLIVF